MSVDVSGYQWMSVDVSGCVNVIFVYQLSFSAYEHHSWLKTVHYMQCANCRSQPSFSAMKQPSPEELPESVIRAICMNWLIKCQYWKCKPGIRRSEVVFCLNDQATIAWLTTRGVFQVTFSAYKLYWGLKKVHYMQSPNCKSQLSCSAMVQPSPIGTREIFSWIAFKVSKLVK